MAKVELMIQRVFREPSWGNRLPIENQRGLTPLVWNHRNPYGQFRLDRNTRLVIAEVQAAVRQVTTLHFLPRVLGLPQYATCRYMKISPENQSRLISDEEIKTAFLTRDDICRLPQEEQEKRWKRFRKTLNKVRKHLSGENCIGILR